MDDQAYWDDVSYKTWISFSRSIEYAANSLQWFYMSAMASEITGNSTIYSKACLS